MSTTSDLTGQFGWWCGRHIGRRSAVRRSCAPRHPFAPQMFRALCATIACMDQIEIRLDRARREQPLGDHLRIAQDAVFFWNDDAVDLDADDFVTKPFDTDELLARLRVALRHRGRSVANPTIVRRGDLDIDFERRSGKDCTSPARSTTSWWC